MTGSQGDRAVQSREDGVGGAGAEKLGVTGGLGVGGGQSQGVVGARPRAEQPPRGGDAELPASGASPSFVP